MIYRLLVSILLAFALACAHSQPSLVIVLAREALPPQAFIGVETHQSGWALWQGSRGMSLPSRALTFGTGLRFNASAQDMMLLMPSHPFENGTAAQAFERRTGRSVANQNRLLAMNAGGLERRRILERTVGARLEQAGWKGAYLYVQDSPPPSPYALLGIGTSGSMTAREYEDLETLCQSIPLLTEDWVLLEVERWDYETFELLLAEGLETWIISLPPNDLSPEETVLTGIARYRARIQGGALTSPSTRWNGMVIDLDIAPTLLRAVLDDRWRLGHRMMGSPAFAPTASRSALSDHQAAWHDTRLLDMPEGVLTWHSFWNGELPRRFARGARAGLGWGGMNTQFERIEAVWHVQRDIAPLILSVFAGFATAWMLTGLLLWRLGRLWQSARRVYLAGLAVFALFPVAAIAGSYCPFPLWTGDLAQDFATNAGWLVACWAVLGLCAALLSHRMNITALTAAALVSIGGVCLDIFIGGGYGVHRSILSLAFPEHHRLYGISDHFAGLLMVFGIMAPAAWMESRSREMLTGTPLTFSMAMFGLLLLVTGLPLMGANAGGVVAMAVGFGIAGLLYAGRRMERWHGPALFGLGGLIALGFLFFDSRQPWQIQSHLGQLWSQMTTGEGNLWEWLRWRFQQDFMIKRAPWLTLTLLVGGCAAFIAFRWFRQPIRRLWRGAPAIKKGVIASLYGAVAMVVSNEAGLLSALMALSALALWLLEFGLGGANWGYPNKNGHAKKARVDAAVRLEEKGG